MAEHAPAEGEDMWSLSQILVAVSATFITPAAGPADDGQWPAGGYRFSDEMGGFRIVEAHGEGTRRDPVVLTQEFYSASPVVLVIRGYGPDAGPRIIPGSPGTALYLTLRTRNASGLGWIEFQFELQEEPGQPSTYGDGLSFDQRRFEPRGMGSDSFELHDRNFEPHDRLLLREGKVDPDETASFSILITDLTPVSPFYLVQDPRIPLS